MNNETYEDRVIQLCSNYAAVAHQFQFRKDEKTPYIAHPGRVSYLTAVLGKLGFIPVCAAWLHDTPEDVAVGPFGVGDYPFIIQNHVDRYRDIRLFLLDNPDIKKSDGKKILELVMILTMSQDPSVPKKQRKVSYIDDIAKESVEACIVKYADRIDNLTTCHIFSQSGFKAYLKDTRLLMDKLSPKVKAVNSLIHLHLERKLEDAVETYRGMYNK